MSPSLKQRVIQGGFWVILGKLLTAGSTMAIHALLTRMLDPEVYGDYVSTLRIVTLCALVAQFGLPTAAVRIVAESLGTERSARARRAVSMCYRYVLFGIAGVALFLLLGGGKTLALRVFDSPLLATMMGGISAWATLMAFQVLTSETFRGFKDLRLASLFGGVITGVVTLALLLLVWLRGGTSLSAVVWITVLGCFVSLVGAVRYLLPKVRALPAGGELRAGELFSISIPLWINGLLTFGLLQSDILVLKAFRPAEEVALYGPPTNLVNLVSQPLILINLVVPPFIAELYFRGERERLQRLVRTAAFVAGFPAFVVLLVFVFFGSPILGTIYGEYYSAGAVVLALLSLGKLANVWTGSCGITLTMTGHQKPMMFITIAATIATLGTSIALAPRYGPVAVAAVVGAGTVVHNVGFWLAARYYSGIWTHARVPSTAEIRSLFASNS